MRILAHGRISVDADQDLDLAGVRRVELERLDLTNLDAVEADARAGGKPSDRTIEHDVITLAAAGEVAHPEHEHEGERQHAEDEAADDQVIGLGFHKIGPLDHE